MISITVIEFLSICAGEVVHLTQVPCLIAFAYWLIWHSDEMRDLRLRDLTHGYLPSC